MKIIKRLIPLVLLFSLLIPTGGAFAYNGGLLEGKTLIYSDGSNVTQLTDRNLSTAKAFSPNTNVSYVFSSPVQVHTVFLASNNAPYKIKFFDSNGTLLGSQDLITQNTKGVHTKLNTPVSNVSKVVLETAFASGSGSPYELDIYGDSGDNYFNGLIDSVGLTSNSIIPTVLYDNDWNTTKGTSENLSGYTLEFTKTVDITKAFIPGNQDGLSRSYTVTYFDSSGNVIATNAAFKPTASSPFLSLSGTGVKKVLIKNNASNYNDTLKEVDLFGSVSLVTWNPTTQNLLSGKTMLLGANVKTPLGTTTKTSDSDLTTYETTNGGSADLTVKDHIFYKFERPIDIEGYSIKTDIQPVLYFYDENGTVINTNRTVDFNGNNNPLSFMNVSYVAVVSNTSASMKTYDFKIFGTMHPEPPKPPGEVKQLQAEPSHNKVKLSWTLPSDQNFQMVRIYRDQVETAFLGGLFGTTAYAAETPIFETNGTYFNDLSVKPETKYEYTLTTVSSEGLESDGVTTQVTTKEEPAPQMDGISYIDENGNLIFTWKQPTTGTVKVFVDGQEYETVPGSNGTITIPKDQVPYSMFGEPKVTFQAIGEYGTPGQVHTPSMKNIETPFGAIDLVNSGMGLLALIAPFLLVALSFLLVPRFRKLIYQAFARFRKNEVPKERRSQEEPKERHEGKEHLERKERIERERQERENRERQERERANKEIPIKQEKEIRERTRQPRERTEKPLRSFGRVRQPRAERMPRERTRQPREPRARRTRGE
jgi:hypothetical protein